MEHGMRTAIIFDNFGPYHRARLRAAAEVTELLAVEVAASSAEYAWKRGARGEEDGGRKPEAGKESQLPAFKNVTLLERGTSREISDHELAARLNRELDDFQPQSVFIPGWSSKVAFIALSWCVRNGVPAVAMSESTEWDEARVAWKEWVKRRIVGLCSAALVGGRPHKDYMVKLGMPAERVFTGYDAVDNDYFAGKAGEARRAKCEMRGKFGLPENYFLASARFIEKKNLPRLIEAYALYRKNSEVRSQKSEVSTPASAPWSLVLLGDGGLRSELCRLITEHALQDFVLLPGFKQYPDLPAYYGLANAFIHASTTEQWGLVVNEAMASGLPVLVSNRCGCAADLVKEGVNGFTFDPFNVEQMAQLMFKLSDCNSTQLSAMVEASREMVAKWGTPAFGAGVLAAGSSALQLARKPATPGSRFLLTVAASGQELFSTPERTAVAGKTSGKRLLIFRYGQRKVLALPAHPYSLHRLGLARYQAHTSRRRAYQLLLSSTLSLGMRRLFSSSIPITDTTVTEIDYEQWMDMLQKPLNRTNLQAVLMWPTQTSRHRLYLHVYDERLEPCAFVKLSTRIEEKPKIEAGFNALVELAAFPFQRFCLAKPLGLGVFNGSTYSIQQPLPANVRPFNWRQDADVSPLARDLCRERKRLDAAEFTKLSWWNNYAGKLPEDCERFHRSLTARLAGGAEVGRVHGDFGPANMVQEGSHIWLFDWEATHPQGPVLADVVGYFLSFSVGKVMRSPGVHLRKFAKRFLADGDPQRRLDVMLALAYRHACGLPDAEVYMRHCAWHEQGRHD